jgi:predicted DNA-binding ribbon-helix-helix protein
MPPKHSIHMRKKVTAAIAVDENYWSVFVELARRERKTVDRKLGELVEEYVDSHLYGALETTQTV